MKAKQLTVAIIAAGALALTGATSGDDWRGGGVATASGGSERPSDERTSAGRASADRPRNAGAESKRADRIRLKLKRSPYGKVLFANGFALYLFTADGSSGSVCNGECAEAWPPLKAGTVAAGKGVRSELLGETTRDDGSPQLTYAGKPLYFYVHDPRGEVYCNDVFEFGGDWFAVKKSGKPA